MGAMLAHVVGLRGQVPEDGVRWTLAGGFALYFLCLAGLEFTLEPDDPPLIPPATSLLLRTATAGAALLLPLLRLPLSWLVAALVSLQLVHMLLGVRAWFASDHAGRPDVH